MQVLIKKGTNVEDALEYIREFIMDNCSVDLVLGSNLIIAYGENVMDAEPIVYESDGQVEGQLHIDEFPEYAPEKEK